jgi:predicted DNA binding CopG/RHH family protein
MAKARTKPAVIPKFSSEAEEATWWDAHRSDVEAEIRRRIRHKPLTLDSLVTRPQPSQPITLRIAKEDLETARSLAARQGLGYQTYIKMLLRRALAERAAEQSNGGFGQKSKRPARANGRKLAKNGTGRGQ